MATPLGMHVTHPGRPKRLIVCCDGTWMDSLGEKGADPPSNVTRISRVFCRTCSDGTHQVINYFAGVGTANAIDRFTGGAFGMGLDQDIREVYNFICTNYVDGDDIILIGFSRGAFTARSVADMIASVGLLTPEGLDRFYAIFDDYENMGNRGRDTDEYLVPGLPEYNGSHGQAKIEWEGARMRKYKQGLREMRYTRDTYHDGVTEIRIKALAVWDTVGTLGIPPAPVIGVRGSADQWRFTNTQISNKVENAFQALALDEPRYAFRPSLWERVPGSTTNLKQVWFPGNHGNVGGGWHDQQISDITLAWMCDQLSTLGVEFNFARMTALFHESLGYSAAHPFPFAPVSTKPSSLLPSLPKLDSIKRTLSKLLPGGKKRECTIRTHSGPPSCFVPHPSPSFTSGTSTSTLTISEDLFRNWSPRPWALGTIRAPTSSLTTLAGKTVRRPGRVLRVDETTNEDTLEPLVGTAERIHSSVRVRLVCGGLGLDDNGVWKCEALLGTGDSERDDEEGGFGRWRLGSSSEYPAGVMYPVGEEDHRWKWVFDGRVEGEGEGMVPHVRELPEEPLVGYWERYLLKMTVGEVDVWRYAQKGL
ncbi:hypothetical protein N657DRAFT_666259 [Parathielavia appendiculata]|uniref:T6SS Phospholipase effector Tle1-like catalytic domain-containing protein n=1 Tax=Parathielavia appendiculata TaxID=2587402 RepID=A0AAN6TTP2_9PEZI|nr:hypothetical protein N657DRAFT_666259 [Parathielavia appendiculata]